MPAKSASQQRLMAAAEHGADFAKARKIRESMSLKQIAEYARSSTKHLPQHVKK